MADEEVMVVNDDGAIVPESDLLIPTKDEILEKLNKIPHDGEICCPGCRAMLEHVTVSSMRFDSMIEKMSGQGISGIMGMLFKRGRH